jgi:hypothetical protein
MAQPRWVGELVCVWMLVACQSAGSAGRRTDARPTDSAGANAAAVPAHDSGAEQWQITAGRAGPFSAGSSEAELRRTYGSGQIDSVRIELGEGETAPGTVLFPADSARRIEILWRDTSARKAPARLILRGSRSEWRVGPGISLGTPLKDLERLNGRPFSLAGFGWDYAGVITDWKAGALDSSLTSIKLYLDPGSDRYQSQVYSQVLGDRDYSSDLPAMQQLNPRVYQIFVDMENGD